MDNATQAPAIVDATAGLETAHNARIVTDPDYIPKANEISLQPIQVLKDQRGLGIFIGRSLIEYGSLFGPHFNGPGQRGLTITDGNAFVRSIGKRLAHVDDDGNTLVSRLLEQVILDVITEGVAEGITVTDPLSGGEGQPPLEG